VFPAQKCSNYLPYYNLSSFLNQVKFIKKTFQQMLFIEILAPQLTKYINPHGLKTDIQGTYFDWSRFEYGKQGYFG
jgi:hypothetical protein